MTIETWILNLDGESIKSWITQCVEQLLERDLGHPFWSVYVNYRHLNGKILETWKMILNVLIPKGVIRDVSDH